jgi:hypothetical protein
MVRTAIAAVISVVVASGCGSGSGGAAGAGGSSSRACIPGMSVACACTNGTQGAQVCTADGAGYGACTCSSGPGAAGATGAAGTSGAAGSAGTTGAAGAGGAAGSTAGAGGAGGSGVIKTCSTWTTVSLSDFNDGTLGGLTTCFGCSGGGCPYVVGQQLYNPSQWNLLCYPGLSATETRAIRISFDVTDKGTMGGMGWDNFVANLKTGTSSAGCGDSNPHSVTYAVPAASLVGHWDLIRWGGNSFQFNYNGALLGEIECALPALSGMAIDFHEGGPGLAQSLIDNFRVEVCASAP